jgi:hypothetical protein
MCMSACVYEGGGCAFVRASSVSLNVFQRKRHGSTLLQEDAFGDAARIESATH